MHDEAPTYKCRPKCPTWDEILCSEPHEFGALRAKTKCKNPVTKKSYPAEKAHKSHKVFVRGFRNMYEYTRALQKGKVKRGDNTKLFTYLLRQNAKLHKTVGVSLLNHNRDVNTLHFKFE